jgi:hypothetical protein
MEVVNPKKASKLKIFLQLSIMTNLRDLLAFNMKEQRRILKLS